MGRPSACNPCCAGGSGSLSESSTDPGDDGFPEQGWSVLSRCSTSGALWPYGWGMSPSRTLEGATCSTGNGSDLLFTYSGTWSRPFPPASIGITADINVIWPEALTRHTTVGTWRTPARGPGPGGAPASPFGGTLFGNGQTNNPYVGGCDASYTAMACGIILSTTCSWSDPNADGIGNWTLAFSMTLTLDLFCRGSTGGVATAPLTWGASYAGTNETLQDFLCTINQEHDLIHTLSTIGEDLSIASNGSCASVMTPDYASTLEIPGTITISPYGGGVPGVCPNPPTTDF